MKIAAITDDGKTISRHFGRAQHYVVTTVEDGKIIDQEMRDKLGHQQFSNQSHEPNESGKPHGFSPAAHDRHLQMSETISDCGVVLCGWMGAGAYNSMVERGIKPVVTDLVSIEEAVIAYVNGDIVDRVDRLH